jgi:hypothetical protein
MMPSSPPQAFPGRRPLLLLAMLSLLSGCANGDFKEVRPSLVRDDVHDWLDSDVTAGTGVKPSGYALTDDERQLRDLAYPLIEPPYDRQQWYSIAGEYGVIGRDRGGPFDKTAYATRLFGAHYRSPSARYAKLVEDIRNDTTRLPAFFETAARVVDMDEKRRKSMDFVPSLSAHEREEALRRIYANRAIIAKVRAKLDERVASYRFALERLVIMTPSPQAVEAERSLDQLQTEIAYYDTHAAPSWAREPSLASAR